jgi:hypothetical protein
MPILRGVDMGDLENTLQLEGIVRAHGYVDGAEGKQFLGAVIECNDGKKWLIDYDEQSPYRAFADRQVVVSGEPFKPAGQHLIGLGLGHFRVSTMRLIGASTDAELVEVGTKQSLVGRFEPGTSDNREPVLSFVTENGVKLLVANDPAGVTTGLDIKVVAYAVELPSSSPRPSGQYAWIICPYSAKDLWEWRGKLRTRSRWR